jgi:hypothetical protein
MAGIPLASGPSLLQPLGHCHQLPRRLVAWPLLDALAGRLEDLHGRALAARRAAEVWPHGGPAVIALREGAGQ